MLNNMGNLSAQDQISETIINWAATRLDEIVFEPKDGFYSFNIVVDAYEKGAEELHKIKQTYREKYFHNAKLSTVVVKDAFEILGSSNVKYNKLFINTSIDGTHVLIVLDNASYQCDQTIDLIYNKFADLQVRYFHEEQNIKIGLMCDSDKLDVNSIKEDGFGFGYDFINIESIF